MFTSEFNKQNKTGHSRNLPLASIIITSYNYEKFLPRAIDSALRQTYPVKEIIVVDDGSTDNSPKIINQYGNQITPVFQKNRGVTSATNAGVFASRGEILFFLDSDDIFFPHKVETMVNHFLQVIPQNPDVLIFHRLEMITDEGILFGYKPTKGLRTVDGKRRNGSFEKLCDPEAAYRHIQKWGFLPFITSPTCGLSLTRSLALQIFPLPEEKALYQDFIFVSGAMLLGAVYGCSQVLGSHITHGDNFSFKPRGLGGPDNLKQTTENFQNDILQKINKNRIASFEDSCYAKSDYEISGSIKGLLKLSYKVPARCFCRETIRFSIKTLWLCFKIVLGIKKKRLTKKEKVYAKVKKSWQYNISCPQSLPGEEKDGAHRHE